MNRAEESVKAILALAIEWCQEHGYDYVSLTAMGAGRGFANTDSNRIDYINVSLGYEEKETPAAGTARESKNITNNFTPLV